MELKHLGHMYDQAANQLPNTVDKALSEAAQYVAGVMKVEISHTWHAVASGAMMNSVKPKKDGAHAYLVGPTQSYSAYVALGTSKMAARPFHISTYNKVLPRLENLNITANLFN